MDNLQLFDTPDELVSKSRKMRFVHRRHPGAKNTVCGVLANFEVGFRDSLTVVTPDQAATMHACKKCFPNQRVMLS